MNRWVEFFLALIILIVLSPVFIIITILIFLTDFQSPFFISKRVGQYGNEFNMYKFRSMKNDAKLKHIVSTSDSDQRITWIGKLIRKFKLDEISQIGNILLGNMKFVGPRPNVKVETDLYTTEEQHILSVKPGITDISSIVFSDLNTILSQSIDPNLDYNQLVRPWKSRLALIYVQNRNFFLDIQILFLTVYNIFFRNSTIKLVQKIVSKYSRDKLLIQISGREVSLFPYPPPGSVDIVMER
jgi:lipopolysaccharide/colanic/teichoic acid biosynthesis glycosyltransferase